MLIQLKTKAQDGSERTRRAKPDVTIAEVEEIAEKEVESGYAVYAAVLVDGKIYSELEA